MMKFDPRLPTTPGIRAPRYGESIMSVNGSPLQVPLAAITGASNGGTCRRVSGCIVCVGYAMPMRRIGHVGPPT